MNLIFIEAKNANTSECNFLKAVLSKHFVDKSVEFICMDGVGNLFQKSIINRMEQAQVDVSVEFEKRIHKKIEKNT